MSLADLIAKINPAHEQAFHHDPAAIRQSVLDKVAKTRDQFANPGEKRGRGRWFSVGNNNTVSFSPTRSDGQPLILNGVSTTYWSADEFPAILDLFQSAVEKGEFDDQLEGVTPAGKSAHISETKVARKAREPKAPGETSRGWSDERRARFAATVAARKAASENTAG